MGERVSVSKFKLSDMKKLNRREFVKLAGIAGGYVLWPPQSAVAGRDALWSSKLGVVGDIIEGVTGFNPTKPSGALEPIPGVKFGMVIDLDKCIGCRRCMYACKRENNVPDAISPPYIMVFETESVTGVSGIYHPPKMPGEGTTMMYTKLRKDKWYMPVQCNHCDDAPCVQVCPTGASYKAPDGIVMIDYDKCIGCRYCMVACPYQARRFNWFHPEVPYKDRNPLVPMREEGVVEKCTFCVHRTRKGKTTRCVEACPNKARTFGNLNDPDSEVSKLIKSERWFRLKDELNTGCNIYYLTRRSEKRMRWYKPLPPPQNIRGLKK
jgi:molybdopterin-containing oxidoreductase family iron-sulfur binding subunit